MDDIDTLIEEKNLEDLNKNGKKYKISVKRTLIGIFSFLMIISAKPTIEYSIARIEADNSQYITNVLKDTNLSREQQITQIYKTAIMENHKISDELKKQLIDAFVSEVIDYAGVFFTDETIKNMYAVAKTEAVRIMNNFEEEHGWCDAEYISYSNLILLPSTDLSKEKALLAHEQMHAILKNGIFDSGFTNITHGHGINEGATVSSVKSDNSYYLQTKTFDLLGLILGYEDIFKTYTNSNLSELIHILNQYIPPNETRELITILDQEVFRRIYQNIYDKK